MLFQGRGDRISFVTLSEGYALEGGLIHASIGKIDQGVVIKGESRSGYKLVLNTAIFRPDGNDGVPNNPVTLLERVLAFKARYFGSITPRIRASWHDQWLGHDQLPSLIAIDLAMDGGTRRINLAIPLRHALQAGPRRI